MPSKTAIRRVHAWATSRAVPHFSESDVTFGLMMKRPVVIAVLEALEECGIAAETEEGWQILGHREALEQELAKIDDDTPPSPSELRPIERVRDVFEYAERCAHAGE